MPFHICIIKNIFAGGVGLIILFILDWLSSRKRKVFQYLFVFLVLFSISTTLDCFASEESLPKRAMVCERELIFPCPEDWPEAESSIGDWEHDERSRWENRLEYLQQQMIYHRTEGLKHLKKAKELYQRMNFMDHQADKLWGIAVGTLTITAGGVTPWNAAVISLGHYLADQAFASIWAWWEFPEAMEKGEYHSRMWQEFAMEFWNLTWNLC